MWGQLTPQTHTDRRSSSYLEISLGTWSTVRATSPHCQHFTRICVVPGSNRRSEVAISKSLYRDHPRGAAARPSGSRWVSSAKDKHTQVSILHESKRLFCAGGDALQLRYDRLMGRSGMASLHRMRWGSRPELDALFYKTVFRFEPKVFIHLLEHRQHRMHETNVG